MTSAKSQRKQKAPLPPMVFLYELEGEQREYPVTKNPFIIGRSPKSDFPIPDSSISKQHAQCTFNGRELVVRDLDSSNGTRINGRKIVENFLGDRDVLEVGTVKLFFKMESDSDDEKDEMLTLGGMTTRLILQIQAPRFRKKLTFSPQKITIGSHEENDIVMAEQGVSRFHAELYTTPEGAWILRDLGSHNGTLIKGIPIENQPLTTGDRFQIGPVYFSVKTKITQAKKEKSGKSGESSLPPALQNPVILALCGLVALLGIAVMFAGSSPPKKKTQGPLASPEISRAFHSRMEHGIRLFQEEEWIQSRDAFQKLFDKYPNSELAQSMRKLTLLWSEFLDKPFGFRRWREVKVEMENLALYSVPYEKKWKDVSQFAKFYKSFKLQLKMEELGRTLFLDGQNLYEKAKNYEASYEKFQKIQIRSVYRARANSFIKSHNLLKKIFHKYMKESLKMERAAHNSNLPEKYASANIILEKLLRKYHRVISHIEREIRKKISENNRNRISLEWLLKAKGVFAKERNFKKAIVYAQRVHKESKYWETARSIIVFSKASKQFTKAQELYQKGLSKDALQILEELVNMQVKEAVTLKKHILKILNYVQSAQNAEKVEDLYGAKKYYQKAFKAEKDTKNKYYRQAYLNYLRIQKKIRKTAKSSFDIGMRYFSNESYRAALEFFKKTQIYDEKNKFIPRIQQAVQERDQTLFDKAKKLQFTNYIFYWKRALAIHQTLVKFLPQGNPIRKKAQEKIPPLRQKIRIRERNKNRLKKKNP